MLVKFESNAAADITMFGDDAKHLLSIIGHSGAIPSALQAQDLPAALQKLEKAVAVNKAADTAQDPDEEFKPGLSQRALPLIQMLKKAIEMDADVMWEKE